MPTEPYRAKAERQLVQLLAKNHLPADSSDPWALYASLSTITSPALRKIAWMAADVFLRLALLEDLDRGIVIFLDAPGATEDDVAELRALKNDIAMATAAEMEAILIRAKQFRNSNRATRRSAKVRRRHQRTDAEIIERAVAKLTHVGSLRAVAKWIKSDADIKGSRLSKLRVETLRKHPALKKAVAERRSLPTLGK